MPQTDRRDHVTECFSTEEACERQPGGVAGE